MGKSLFDKFWLTEAQINPLIKLPDISEAIQQTLNRNMGFFEAGGIFKLLRTDGDGRLLVSTADVDTTNILPSVITVPGVVTQLLQANVNRRWFSIQNIGDTFCAVGSTNAVTYANGAKIPPFTRLSDDTYVGPIFANSILGNAVVLVLEN